MNNGGFRYLTVQAEIFSPTMVALPVTALVDTGASVSLLSPSLIALLRCAEIDREMMCHGVDGVSNKRLVTFGLRIGEYSRDDCLAIPMANSLLGHDIVLGLDVLLETGLTLTPGGEHRLEA